MLAALAFTNSPPIWAIYAIAILGGAAVVIEGPSRQALVYQLVGRDELPNAIALNASLFNAARAVGPALGGVLIAVVGVGWCFMFNALVHGRLDHAPTDAHRGALPGRARPGPATDLQGDQGRALVRVGLAADAHDPHLHGHDEPRGVQLPRPRAVARVGRLQCERDRLRRAVRELRDRSDPRGALRRRSRAGQLAAFSLGAAGLSLSALGIAVIGGVPAAIVLLFTAGVSFTTWVANGQSLLQLAAPDQLRGRVVSIYIFVFAGFMPVSAVAEGWLADVLGTRFAFASAGLVGLLAAGYAFRRLRAIYSGRSGPLAGPEHRSGAGVSAAEDDGGSIPPGADAAPSPWRLSSGLLKIIAIGLVAGLFSSLFGVGGGIVAVPLLMMLAGFPAHEATGTSLAAIVITATVGATLYAIEGEVDFARAALVGIPAVGGVLLGTALQQRIPARNLTFAFAALLVGLGIWMLLGDGTEAAAGSSADTRTIVAALAAGIAAGVLAGLFGVGGGILFVPALAALGLGQLSAEATSLVAVIPTVLVGAYRQHGYGNVRVKTACILGVSSVAGVYVGVLVALAADESHLRKLFGVLLIATAAQLAWRSAKAPRRS